MAVDDAELLALAGGDSSDEETPQESGLKAKAVSPLPSIEISRTDSETFAASNNRGPVSGSRGSAKTVKKTARKRESEDDGEASLASQDSAPMSESESGSAGGDAASDDDAPFPVDNKFYSQKDKKEIMSLPEVERESILAERAAIHERKLQDLKLRRLLQAREKMEAQSLKRKAGADVEDSPRKSSRQKKDLGGRKVGEASDAIEAYKKQREQKTLKDEQRRREGANRAQLRQSSSEGRYSSADADGDSEVEWDDAKAKKKTDKEHVADDQRLRNSQPADFNDFRRVTWSRFQLAELCFHPGFEDTVAGCYVRVPSKPAPGSHQMQYSLLPVKHVFEKENYNYAVTKQNDKRFITNQHLMCSEDGAEKEVYFGMVSNSSLTEVDVANHKAALANSGKSVPTHSYLDAKLNEIHTLINHSFTEDQLQRKLQRSGALQKRMAPLEKTAILSRRQAAIDRGDEAGIAKADAELAALDGPKLRYNTHLVDPTPATVAATAAPSQQERLAELNKMNRKKNAEDVRRAQHAEQKAARLARQAVERGEAVQDPFARVKTHAKTHHDINETLAPHRTRQQLGSRDISRSGTPSTPKLEAKKEVNILTPEHKPVIASGLPVLSSRNMDDEILAAMDIGIDVEI